MAVSAEALDIILRLQGGPEYVAGMGEASGATDRFAASTKRAAAAGNEQAASSKKQINASALVSKAMKVTGAAVAGVAVASVMAAVKWEDMSKTVSQQTGLTGKALDSLMATIESTARKAPYAIQEIADSAVLLKTKFGLTDSQIEKTSGLMVAFAKRAGGSSQDVTTSLLSIMQNFRQPLSSVVQITDQLVSVSQKTQKPMSDMLGVIEKFGPKLQAMGFGLSETIKLLGIFQASGVPTNMLGRGLATGITKAEKLSKETGTPVPEIIKTHIQEIEQATTTQEAYSKATEYFGAQVGPSLVTALLHNKKAFQEVEGAMGKTGSTMGLLEAQQKSATGKWQEMKNQLFFVAKNIGEQLLPALTSALKTLLGLVKIIVEVTDKGKLLGPIIFGLAGAWLAYKAAVVAVAIVQGGLAVGTAILGSDMVYLALSSTSAADAMAALSLAMDANPVGLIALAIVALIAGLVMLILHFKEVVNFLRGPWGTVLVLMMGPAIAFPLLLALHFNKAMAVFSGMISWISTAWGKLGHILAYPFEWLWGKVLWVVKQIKGALSSIINSPGHVWKSITGGINSLNIPGMPSFAAGGVMGSSGFAMINETAKGETVWLPGGSSVQPSPATSLAEPRAHTPNPAPAAQPSIVMVEAWLTLPGAGGRRLFKLMTQEAAIKEART
jgi:TP901 family phage tail tape measure protein